MPHISRRTFLELAGATMICGCGGQANFFTPGSSPLLAFSDIHFNPFYTQSQDVFNALDASDSTAWQDIFEGSGVTAPSIWGADTNYPLLQLALASLQRNIGASQVVVYSGDLLGHNIPTLYETAANSKDPSRIVAFTNKVAAFVMEQIRAAVGNVPVVFAVGNCDSYTGYGPDPTFLANTAEMFYSQMLNGTANQSEFMSTFKSGGYYSVELFDKQLLVIGLNTIVCSPLVPVDNSALIAQQFSWLNTQLAAAKAAEQKVWIIMHVPVGGFLGATAANVSSSGKITAAQMMWEDAYQSSFLSTIGQYPNLITMLIAGHTHMDEYRLMMPGLALEIAPGISPVFKNDPAYKLFTLDLNTFIPSDYNAMKYSLATLPTQFQSYYTFSEAYAAPNYCTGVLEKLYPNLATDPAHQALFRQNYYSGNNAANGITNLTWPVYWSGVGNVTAEGIVAGVNSY